MTVLDEQDAENIRKNESYEEIKNEVVQAQEAAPDADAHAHEKDAHEAHEKVLKRKTGRPRKEVMEI